MPSAISSSAHVRLMCISSGFDVGVAVGAEKLSFVCSSSFIRIACVL